MRAHALAAVVLTIATQNVRLGMTPAHTHHDINAAASRAAVVMTQEMGQRRARNYAPPGYGTAHHAGMWRGDCALYWNRAEWRLARPSWVVPITRADGFHGGHRWALVTVLKQAAPPHHRVAVVCLHMITHWGQRVPVERAGIARLTALRHRLSAHWPRLVMGGDWNRRYVHRAAFPPMTAARPPRPTHAPRKRIDYLFSQHMRVTRTAVIGHTVSDHNGALEVLKWLG